MTPEMHGGNGEAGFAETEPATQETIELLLETVRVRCLTDFREVAGNSGIMWKGTYEGKRLHINLDSYTDNSGPTRHDADGRMLMDTSGRYQYSHDSFYYDTGVQATIFKIEKAKESQTDSKKLFTSYEITTSGQGLDIEKRVGPFGLPVFVNLGDRTIPAEDNPPLITTQERVASEQEEDEMGFNVVSEREANDLIELLRAI